MDTALQWLAVIGLGLVVAGAIADGIRRRVRQRRAEARARELAEEAERQYVLRSLAAADYAQTITLRRRNGGGLL